MIKGDASAKPPEIRDRSRATYEMTTVVARRSGPAMTSIPQFAIASRSGAASQSNTRAVIVSADHRSTPPPRTPSSATRSATVRGTWRAVDIGHAKPLFAGRIRRRSSDPAVLYVGLIDGVAAWREVDIERQYLEPGHIHRRRTDHRSRTASFRAARAARNDRCLVGRARGRPDAEVVGHDLGDHTRAESAGRGLAGRWGRNHRRRSDDRRGPPTRLVVRTRGRPRR